MDKKIIDVVDAFEGCRFEECLRLSDQIFKKMGKSDAKKKTNMSEDQLNILYITRIGALAATGHIDQAHELITQRFTQPIISAEHSFLFLQVCTMALDSRLNSFSAAIQNQKDKKKIDINRFVLLSRNFSGLSRIFLKKFMQESKSEDNLKQIYLQYLQQLQNQKMVSFTRDKIIIQCKELKFQIISMFLDKFIKKYEQAPKNHKNQLQETISKKIVKSVKDLKLKIAIHEGKSEVARYQYKNIITQPLCYPFPYLRSIKKLSNQQEQNRAFWAKQYIEIFKANLNIDQYRPIYAYNQQFISELLKQIGNKSANLNKPNEIQPDDLYKYDAQPLNQLQVYYDSIYSEMTMYRAKEEQLKKKDFYLISMKNLLLQLISISISAEHYELAKQFLCTFKCYFGKTLTFPNQIQQYLANNKISDQKFMDQFIQEPHNNSWKPDDKLIWLINIQKMFHKNHFNKDICQMFERWDHFYKLYQENLNQVEQQKHLQKGQRYLSDQFLVFAADSVRIFTEKHAATDKIREDSYFYIVSKLQNAIEVSPYNADLKLRLIYFYNQLNYSQMVLQVCQTMDIKAVQFETIGYLQLKSIINSSLYDVQQALLVRMVRSYQQNFRQSSQYAYKAIQHLSFDECEQNLTYHDNIDKSYNNLVLLYTLYIKNQNNNSNNKSNKFYLEQILRRMQQNKNQLTLNCDYRIFCNRLDSSSEPFVDFYGILNCWKILKNQCMIKLAINQLSENIDNCNIQNIRFDWQVKDVYDFTDYVFFQRKLEYKYTGNTHSERNMKLQTDNYNKITDIRVTILRLLLKIKKEDLDQCRELSKQITTKINEYNQFLSHLSWRLQTKLIPIARCYVGQIISGISLMIQAIMGNKKKISKPGQRKQVCNLLIASLVDSVSDNIKWQQPIKIEKQNISERLLQKQQILERVSKMSSYEFRKSYRVKS